MCFLPQLSSRCRADPHCQCLSRLSDNTKATRAVPPPPKKAIIENQYHNKGEQRRVFSLIANYEQFTKVVNSWQNK